MSNVVEFPDRRPVEPWLSTAALADHLGVSSRQVGRWVSEGMPSVRWGRRMRRFRLSEVEDWLNRRAA